jgi:hypothetical protein
MRITALCPRGVLLIVLAAAFFTHAALSLPTPSELSRCATSEHFQNGCTYNCTFLVKGGFLEEDHMACELHSANRSLATEFVESDRDPVRLFSSIYVLK